MSPLAAARGSSEVDTPCLSDPVDPRTQQKASFLSSILALQQKEKGIPRESKGTFWQRKRKILFILGIVLVVIAVICAAVVTELRRRGSSPKKPPAIPHPSGQAPFLEAFQTNFPDPAIIQVDGTWYAFATNNAAGLLNQPFNKTVEDFGKANVQLATSTDFQNWTLHNYTADPLPVLGNWVASGFRDVTDTSNVTESLPLANVWAPDILKRPSDGKFVLYYSATAGNAIDNHCIGAATADAPQGPYTPLPTPLACPTNRGGAIDPAPFIDVDGKIYVSYKIDGNNLGHGGDCGNTVPPQVGTPILLQLLEDDATTPSGSPVEILDRTDSDGPLVEAPSLVRSDEGVYFLFFSSGCTRMPSYDLKYATSSNVTGPYERASGPLLVTGDYDLLAPGSASVRKDGDEWRMVFHSRVTTPFGDVRTMQTAALTLNGTEVVFES